MLLLKNLNKQFFNYSKKIIKDNLYKNVYKNSYFVDTFRCKENIQALNNCTIVNAEQHIKNNKELYEDHKIILASSLQYLKDNKKEFLLNKLNCLVLSWNGLPIYNLKINPTEQWTLNLDCYKLQSNPMIHYYLVKTQNNK